MQNTSLKWYNNSSICVVLVSGGYPGKYEKYKPIYGLDKAEETKEIIVFHAGTTFKTSVEKNIVPNQKFSEFVSSGGRVLGITGRGNTLKEAIDKTYKAIENVTFDKMHYRKDIGKKGLKLTTD